eukprot:251383-Prorocentrum_minimum.AAC.1
MKKNSASGRASGLAHLDGGQRRSCPWHPVIWRGGFPPRVTKYTGGSLRLTPSYVSASPHLLRAFRGPQATQADPRAICKHDVVYGQRWWVRMLSGGECHVSGRCSGVVDRHLLGSQVTGNPTKHNQSK